MALDLAAAISCLIPSPRLRPPVLCFPVPFVDLYLGLLSGASRLGVSHPLAHCVGRRLDSHLCLAAWCCCPLSSGHRPPAYICACPSSPPPRRCVSRMVPHWHLLRLLSAHPVPLGAHSLHSGRWLCVWCHCPLRFSNGQAAQRVQTAIVQTCETP